MDALKTGLAFLIFSAVLIVMVLVISFTFKKTSLDCDLINDGIEITITNKEIINETNVYFYVSFFIPIYQGVYYIHGTDSAGRSYVFRVDEKDYNKAKINNVLYYNEACKKLIFD